MRILIAIIAVTLTVQLTFSQQKESAPNFPSPNVSSFTVFGDIPVNKFTGAPDISIPLYEIKESPISVPITLGYHPATVQANNHPGWTGLGMSLLCGGVITRIQHGFPDEQKTANGMEIGFYYNSSVLNTPDWQTPAKMEELGYNSTFGDLVDPMADEFTFNFMGYSGRFIMDYDGQWKVIGDDKIKVVIDTDGIIDVTQIRSNIYSRMPAGAPNAYYRLFNKFKLITPDGTTYEFGGVNATEYSIPYRAQSVSYVIPTSWYLTKIKAPNGREVNFDYEAGALICTLAQQYSYTKYSSSSGGGWFALGSSCSGQASNLTRLPADGHLIFPVYLKSITTSHSFIEFLSSPTTERRYTNYDLGNSPVDPNNIPLYFDDPSELQWAKLDQIKISDRNAHLFKTFNFTYTSSTDTRLKLLSVQEFDKSGNSNTPYIFQYSPDPLPPYCSDQSDHWGYFNGYDVDSFHATSIEGWVALYPTARQPTTDYRYFGAELLNRITYPTGGYTLFAFEPHKYSKEVSDDRSQLTPYAQAQTAGGVRIQSITTFGKGNFALNEKRYLYLNGYTGQINTNSLTSSGILAGRSQYYWPGYVGKDLDGNTFTYDIFSSNSLLPSYVNAQGSHIGYSQVTEKTTNNGFTNYYYSNFDTDVFGIPHMDLPALNHTDGSRSVYSPSTSMSLERGALQLVETYDESDRKVKSVKTQYEASSSDYIRTLSLQHFDICSTVTASAQIWFGTAYQQLSYNYHKIKEDETIYDSDQDRSHTSTIQYTYDLNNLVARITQTNSNGKEQRKEFLYAPQVNQTGTPLSSEADAIQNMAGVANMINYPLEITEYYDGKVTRSSVHTYKITSARIVPSKDYQTELPAPASVYGKISLVASGSGLDIDLDGACQVSSTYSYDNFGNVKEITTEDGITTAFVWGYKHIFPIAKVVNATYTEVEAVLGTTVITNLNDAPGDDASVRVALQVLRTNANLAKAQTTTYTYDPLTSITSKTDPNGKTDFYEYDLFGRLKLVRDYAGNVVKEYKYNYQK